MIFCHSTGKTGKTNAAKITETTRIEFQIELEMISIFIIIVDFGFKYKKSEQ
jgi:hypothetical protein